jgi:hypothetical protein
MRRLARVLTIVTMAALAVIILLLAGTNLRASVAGVLVQAATEEPAAFDTIAGAILSGDMGSDQFKKVSEPDPARYELVTYRARIKNPGILKADWVRIRLAPTEDDVALLATPTDVGPFGAAEVTAVLLTAAGSDAKRDVWIEYYVLGSRMSQAAPWSENG